jgi:cyclase
MKPLTLKTTPGTVASTKFLRLRLPDKAFPEPCDLCCGLASTLASRAVAQDQAVPLSVRPLADGIFLIHPPPDSITANVVVVAGADGIMLSDCGLGVERENLAAAIAGLPVNNQTVRYIVNTHWHRDHTGGNRYFGSGASIIAHSYTRATLAKPQKLLGSTVQAAPPEALPTRTFDESARIVFDRQTIEFTHVPAAHTGGDIYAHFVEQSVLHIGDVYYGPVFPWVDADHGGSVIGIWRAIRALINGKQYDAIVPGHGPVVTMAALQNVDRMMTDSFAAVDEGIRLRRDLTQIQERGLPAEWSAWSWAGNPTEAWLAAVHASIQRGEVAP